MPGRKPRKKLTSSLTLRLPGELHRKLKDLAGREDRSVNAQAIRALESYLTDPESAERHLREKQGRG